jgi:hypothetical protein
MAAPSAPPVYPSPSVALLLLLPVAPAASLFSAPYAVMLLLFPVAPLSWMNRNCAVKRVRLRKSLACMTARRRRDLSPDVHLYELFTLLGSLKCKLPGAVMAFTWNIQHRLRQHPRIRIVMLVDKLSAVAVVLSVLETAFEDIDDLAFVVTVDADAYFAMAYLE